jgi:hypothetical protein
VACDVWDALSRRGSWWPLVFVPGPGPAVFTTESCHLAASVFCCFLVSSSRLSCGSTARGRLWQFGPTFRRMALLCVLGPGLLILGSVA